TCMKQGCQDPPGFINLSSRYARDQQHPQTILQPDMSLSMLSGFTYLFWHRIGWGLGVAHLRAAAIARILSSAKPRILDHHNVSYAALVSGGHSAGIFPECQDPAGLPALLHSLKLD
ncbi:hypothetical protein CEP51_016495, partial [Fusarium floridanum]